MLISESSLCAAYDLKIIGYTLYRQDRTYRGGSTCTYVRRSLNHYVTETPTQTLLEATTMLLKTKFGELRLTSVYNRPHIRLEALSEFRNRK